MNRTSVTIILSLGAWVQLFAFGDAQDAEPRKWVSADGLYSVEATLLAIQSDSVRLRRSDGKQITVPLAKLSEGDRAYLAEFMRRARDAQAEGQRFTIDGVLSIASPGDGFLWKKVNDLGADGVKGFVLLCQKEGSNTAVTLVAELRHAANDGERLAALKGNYNGLVGTLQQAGFTELKGTKPSLEPPIADLVAFKISGKKPDGSPAELRAASIFGQHTYSFQVISADATEADRLLQLAATLREFEQ